MVFSLNRHETCKDVAGDAGGVIGQIGHLLRVVGWQRKSMDPIQPSQRTAVDSWIEKLLQSYSQSRNKLYLKGWMKPDTSLL